jgi:secreted Zn-dependent insulinase-like peptidase
MAKVLAKESEVIAPPQHKRRYRVIQLPNKLRAVLVNDDEADKAAVAADVAVGQL